LRGLLGRANKSEKVETVKKSDKPEKVKPVKKYEIDNRTDKNVVIRTGKSNADYDWFWIPAKKKVEVTPEQAKAVAKRIKQVKLVGVTVTKHLVKPLQKPKKKAEGEEASSEIN